MDADFPRVRSCDRFTLELPVGRPACSEPMEKGSPLVQ